MDLRVGRGDNEAAPWSVLSDLTITIVLVLVLYIVLQFVQTFRERLINSRLAERQAEVRKSIASVLKPAWHVQIDSLAPDRQRITFSSEVLFQQCQATLKPEGAELLRTLGKVLGARGRYFEAVHVEGHTDAMPIRRSRDNCPFPSNWELSSARATSVVALFSRDGLVANPKLSAIGRAEYHPVDITALDPNRRIELILQYDREHVARDLGVAKVVHTAKPESVGPPTQVAPEEDARVVAIRELYEEVERSAGSGELDASIILRPCGATQASIYRDRNSRIRKLALKGESEHVNATAEYYYDGESRLRFAFLKLTADNGTIEETRVYLDPDGREVRRLENRRSGPGYPGGFQADVRQPERYAQPCS